MNEYDHRSIEEKWQRRWEEVHAFEADPDPAREPYFVNFPYPYMNGYLHLGHTFSLLQLEFAARYHRLLGRNVLWPFAFHCTGTPIVAAAERVADGEETQISMLREMGVPEEHIAKMGDPVYWTEYFPEVTKEFAFGGPRGAFRAEVCALPRHTHALRGIRTCPPPEPQVPPLPQSSGSA